MTSKYQFDMESYKVPANWRDEEVQERLESMIDEATAGMTDECEIREVADDIWEKYCERDIEFLWYACMTGPEDDDWGDGSYSEEEAYAKVKAWREDGYYPDAYIAVINNSAEDAVCVDEIRFDD